MPVAAAAQKLRRFRHRFGIRATKMEVRPRVAWYAYAFAGALSALLVVLMLFLLEHYLRSPEMRDVEQLRDRLAQLESQVGQGDGVVSSLEMSRSANRLLGDELRAVADENAILKDDLAYFLRLVPVGTNEGEVRLDRLVVRPDAQFPHRYRFSVMVGYQSGRQPQEFKGALQFMLTVVRGGRDVQLPWPARGESVTSLQLSTKHWVRKEGAFDLEPGDQLKQVELKLLQGSQERARATVNF